ncbi:E3 ubiquitin-protein ligase Praja-1 [Sciurus carolinensis]|uniref:RING-type E3 ubiquitin transferase n=1 Tax=Sciurus carolinensis TaxID=30640 RepID=A0AA41MP71_SCICA|nr:E3 ubiquitin-protein ligase Praja-1 [Sciurus carolinensis]
MADPDFWTYSDDDYKYCDEDSDSDKEWIAALRRKYRSREQNLSSSGESWETLPGKEEREPQQARVSVSVTDTSPGMGAGASASASADAISNGSSYLEEAQEPSLQEEEQTSLEEGEIPWLQYNENESSHEGDNNSVPDLRGTRGRLAQAMETALAHLESLAVDVEVANPLASKKSIDALPEILVTEDHGAVGQEMCCSICCSEYVKGEVATELPCHHYFHKPCVSIWLQKSGTCPECRCMFPPPL